MDESNLLIGTEGGKIEHRTDDKNTNDEPLRVYDAHPESQAGISAIIELHTESHLLRGLKCDPDVRLIATASEGAPQFRIWKLHKKQRELLPYLKIETTFTNGIKYLLETHDTQLAAANEGQIKFYDFICKNMRENKAKEDKAKDELNTQMKKLFDELDANKSMKLNKEDTWKYITIIASKL